MRKRKLISLILGTCFRLREHDANDTLFHSQPRLAWQTPWGSGYAVQPAGVGGQPGRRRKHKTGKQAGARTKVPRRAQDTTTFEEPCRVELLM
ncbi:uncharacterized protein LOC144291787 isoform X2 [Canis aureus]